MVRIRFENLTDPAKVMKEVRRDIARAATKAVGDATKLAQSRGKTALASAGMGSRFQKALQAKLYPPHGESLNPIGIVALKIGYASVFEEGATISGKPLLWIPLPSVPNGPNGNPLSPKEYGARVGGLVTLRVPGKPPMLAGIINSADQARITKSGKINKRAIKSAQQRGRLTPLYIGVHSITEPKKYDLKSIFREAGDEIPALYESYLKQALGDR